MATWANAACGTATLQAPVRRARRPARANEISLRIAGLQKSQFQPAATGPRPAGHAVAIQTPPSRSSTTARRSGKRPRRRAAAGCGSSRRSPRASGPCVVSASSAPCRRKSVRSASSTAIGSWVEMTNAIPSSRSRRTVRAAASLTRRAPRWARRPPRAPAVRPPLRRTPAAAARRRQLVRPVRRAMFDAEHLQQAVALGSQRTPRQWPPPGRRWRAVRNGTRLSILLLDTQP